MKRCIEFRKPAIYWSDKIEITINQVDSLSDEYEISITSSYTTIKN